MRKPNSMDTRNRSAFDVVKDLRGKFDGHYKVAVLGSHQIDATSLAAVLADAVEREVGPHEPFLVVTGCAPVGVEKAARLMAKDYTGRPAVVFHRADIVYGPKKAEEMRDVLLAQEASCLVVVTLGGKKKTCQNLRDRFTARGKKVHVIEVEA